MREADEDRPIRYLPMPTDRTIRERVKRGAKYLDEHLQFDWRTQITNDLDLENATKCVLGQVFGQYTDGLQRLAELNGLNWGEEGSVAPVTHGFCVPWRDIYVNKEGAQASGVYWGKLELAWRRELGLDLAKIVRDPESGYYVEH